MQDVNTPLKPISFMQKKTPLRHDELYSISAIAQTVFFFLHLGSFRPRLPLLLLLLPH